MEVCENCGLPAWAVGPGYKVTIEVRPANKFKRRASKRTVWCHDRECAVQTLAIARYGLPTYRWPITLAQFRGLPETRAILDRCKCYETPLQDVDSTGAKNGKNGESTTDTQNEFRNAPTPVKTRKGRPRKYVSGAARQRAYRERATAFESRGA